MTKRPADGSQRAVSDDSVGVSEAFEGSALVPVSALTSDVLAQASGLVNTVAPGKFETLPPAAEPAQGHAEEVVNPRRVSPACGTPV